MTKKEKILSLENQLTTLKCDLFKSRHCVSNVNKKLEEASTEINELNKEVDRLKNKLSYTATTMSKLAYEIDTAIEERDAAMLHSI